MSVHMYVCVCVSVIRKSIEFEGEVHPKKQSKKSTLLVFADGRERGGEEKRREITLYCFSLITGLKSVLSNKVR